MRSILPLFAAALLTSIPALAAGLVDVPQFHSVELRGGGAVDVLPGPQERVAIIEGSSRFTHIYVKNDGQLVIDNCTQPCPQGYRLKVEVQSPRAPGLAVDGGGQIVTAQGFSLQQELAAAVRGGGHIDARSVDAVHVSAAVDGGGNIAVHPHGTLSAAVRGGGHIRYDGNPTTAIAIRGGGDVSRGN